MTDTDGQDGLNPVAAEETTPSAPEIPSERSLPETAEVLLAEAVLDDSENDGLPALPEVVGGGEMDPDLAALLDTPPVEAAAGPQAGSGGGSSYSSDFGQLVAGLRATGLDPGAEDAAAVGADPLGIPTDDDSLLILPSTTSAPTVPGNGEGAGGGDNSTLGGGEKGGEESELAGPGADQGLFTNQADVVDLNDIDAGGYLDGTQYDALNQHDTVILPSDADEAAEAGFVPGTWFFGNNGHDHITGGNLADLIDGGNGRDTLLGGGGNDVMSGGSGKDVFAYSLAADEGEDVILDFETGNGGDRLAIADLVDVNGDGDIDVADLDAGGHSVTGTADSVIITFDTGTTLTLENVDGTGVSSFDDLLDIKVNIDIV